jgi:hypothetical protein
MILILLGLFFIGIGCYTIINSIRTKKNAAVVEAVFTGYQNENGAEYPMVHFEYNGEEFDMAASTPAKKHIYNNGDSLQVYYKENSERISIVGDNGEVKLGIGLLIAGIAIFVLSVMKFFMGA